MGEEYLEDFYKWSSDNLSKLNGLDHTSEEAKQIKIEMDKRLKELKDE